MIPFAGAVESYLAIFNSLPQPVRAFITVVLTFFIIGGLLRIIFKL